MPRWTPGAAPGGITRARTRARVRLPEALVQEISQAESESTVAWTAAREQSDWNALRGPLRRLVALKRREAEAISDDDQVYDALLDGYEPGAQAATLAPVFANLSARLAPLVAEGSNRPTAWLPDRYWPRNPSCDLLGSWRDSSDSTSRTDVSASRRTRSPVRRARRRPIQHENQ